MRLNGECQYSDNYYGSNSICTKSCVMTFMPWNGSDMLVVSVHGSFLHSIIQSIWLLAFSGILYSTVVQNTVTCLMSETKKYYITTVLMKFKNVLQKVWINFQSDKS